jgi:hypothetical protein
MNIVVKEWLQSDARELGFQHVTDTDTVYAMKQKHAEEGREDKSEIRTAMRSLNSLQIQANITNYFSKQMSVV